MFSHNSATHHGGAIYSELISNIQSKIVINTTDIEFNNNTALIGSDVYIDIPTSCDDICLNNNIFIEVSLTHSQFGLYITTPPSKLEFYNKATCIEGCNDTSCEVYLTRGVMLGQEIVIDVCTLDYYDQPAEGTLFIVTSNTQDHHINGSQYVLMTCTFFRGISVVGKRITNTTNFTMTITSHDGSTSDLKTISTKLIIELSPCHPGFHYDNGIQSCVCYNDADIVSCSGSTSSIKKKLLVW